jgi:hypothetical protein
MVMIHVREHLFTKGNSKKIPVKTNLRTFTEAQNRRSWMLIDRPLPKQPGRQAIRSDCLITIPTPTGGFFLGGGGDRFL